MLDTLHRRRRSRYRPTACKRRLARPRLFGLPPADPRSSVACRAAVAARGRKIVLISGGRKFDAHEVTPGCTASWSSSIALSFLLCSVGDRGRYRRSRLADLQQRFAGSTVFSAEADQHCERGGPQAGLLDQGAIRRIVSDVSDHRIQHDVCDDVARYDRDRTHDVR
jgi:hypothetical protein